MEIANSNYTVDKNSGAVLFRRSPEVQSMIKLKSEIAELKTDIKAIDEKLNLVLELLKEVNHSG